MHSSVASIPLHATRRRTGRSVRTPDFAQYHYCWLRDGSFIAYASSTRLASNSASNRYHEWVNRAVGAHQRSDPPCNPLAPTRQAVASRPHAACPLCPRRFHRCRRLAQLPDRWLRHLAVGSRSAPASAPGRTGFQTSFRPSVERVGRYLDAFAVPRRASTCGKKAGRRFIHLPWRACSAA